jgi:hypothetical protein
MHDLAPDNEILKLGDRTLQDFTSKEEILEAMKQRPLDITVFVHHHLWLLDKTPDDPNPLIVVRTLHDGHDNMGIVPMGKPIVKIGDKSLIVKKVKPGTWGEV